MTTTGEAELRRALDSYERVAPLCRARIDRDDAAQSLGYSAARLLPALLAELDRLRAAMGEDIETRAGFSGKATEALK